MSIFGNSGRPGKGLTKEQAAKRNYFGIFFRHFLDLCKLNLLYFACNLVFIAAIVWLSLPYLLNLDSVIEELFTKPVIFLPPEPFIPFLFMGPFIAGLTYVLRNWSRQEHAFLVSDFFEQSKLNWKQGLALSVLSTVFTYLFSNAVIFYLKTDLPTMFVLPVAGVITIMLVSMSFYTYPMMVTFDMKLKDILVNAWIFSMVKLPQNIFYILIIALVHGLLLRYVPVIWAILMIFILICWTGYTMNYYAWHVINKYLMSQVATEPEEETEENENTEELL